MSPRKVVNTVSTDLSSSKILSGLFLAESGYFTKRKTFQEILETTHEMRLYYLVSGKGVIHLAGKTHTIQQHDVFFQPKFTPLQLTINSSVPAEIWWIDFYGPAVDSLMNKLSITNTHPLINGICEPRFFQELKTIVIHYDYLSAADELHIASGLNKIFALLLESCSSSQWIAVPHDNENILYTGHWKPWPAPIGDAHEEYYTAMPKAYAEYNFYGSGIKWLGTVNHDCGKADVLIDGIYQTTVDTYSPVRLTKQLLYINSKLNYGHHIIKIFCTGTKNDKSINCDIVIESFQYFLSSSSFEGNEGDLNTSTQMCRKAVELMRSSAHNMTVDKLAKTLGVSRSYLTVKFTNEVGVSPSQFLIQIRMENAKKLLAETDMNVSQVASTLGYTDVFYFSRLFRKRENLTPTQYKKLTHKK
ncbi:AraC family transcriptional regulator [Azotosporobacter soli]|uniref:AraC family transcriptional regulator n=1 Tax=Azotosporobacter soli TaxID=3055040 RepID=UPI0031FED6EC